MQVIQHLGFWALSFAAFLWMTTQEGQIQEVDILYTFLFHLLLLPVVYINLNRFLYKLRIPYGWYIYFAKLIVLLSVATYINYSFFQHWSIFLIPGYYFISYFTWWEIAIIYFVYITITTLMKGTRSWFLLWKVRSELAAAEKQKVQLELQVLKAQINPHFFFNTLNGIYSMSLDNDKRLPQTILQLSDLMRYFLYEAKDDFVLLSKELSLLKNYLSLQKLRLGNSLNLQSEITGEIAEQKIAPMLLITFLENSFKHGDKTIRGAPFLILKIKVEKNGLDFYLENEKGLIDDIEDKQYGGVGLSNIRRRLELLYPEKHSLQITEEGNKYIVHLQLATNAY